MDKGRDIYILILIATIQTFNFIAVLNYNLASYPMGCTRAIMVGTVQY
jgi:hypothetical protein